MFLNLLHLRRFFALASRPVPLPLPVFTMDEPVGCCGNGCDNCVMLPYYEKLEEHNREVTIEGHLLRITFSFFIVIFKLRRWRGSTR
jgi:hypothetical protein